MSTLFQITIEHVLKSQHLLDAFQTQADFHVRFDMPPYQPLVIERHGERISVAHYYEQNGDLVPDPDVELQYPSWTPTAITQALGIRREKFIERDGRTFVDTLFHKQVSFFLALWARNIQAQGWAENGQVHDDEWD